jgi:hypothetical protein
MYKERLKLMKIDKRIILGRNKLNNHHFNLIVISFTLIYLLGIIVKIKNISEFNISYFDIILLLIIVIISITIGALKAIRRNSINTHGLVINTDILKWSNVLSFHWYQDDKNDRCKLQLVAKYNIRYKSYIREANFEIDSVMKEKIQEVLDLNQIPKRQL